MKLPGNSSKQQLQAMSSEPDTIYVNSLHRAKGNTETKQRGQRDNKARKQTNESNYATDAAMSPKRATKSVQLAVFNAIIAINAVILAKFAEKEASAQSTKPHNRQTKK